jgi:hypothetical protein
MIIARGAEAVHDGMAGKKVAARGCGGQQFTVGMVLKPTASSSVWS